MKQALRFLGLVGLTLLMWAPRGSAIPAGVQEFYLPLPAELSRSIFVNIDNDPTVSREMHYVVGVTASANNTRIYYDHWENGLLTGAAGDLVITLNQGQFYKFESANIPTFPRGTSIHYDGGDRLFIVGGLSQVVVSIWPESPGTVFTDAWEVYPVQAWERHYVSPMGENLAGSLPDFSKVWMLVMSGTDGNSVQINDPAGPGLTTTLNRGQAVAYEVRGSGTTVVATYPIQVNMMTGRFRAGTSSEMRGYTLVPQSYWSNEYVAPVPSWTNPTANTNLLIYNPNPSAITINFEDKLGSGSFTIPANSVRDYRTGTGRYVPVNSGARLWSSTTFWAVAMCDTGSPTYDWGYSLIPVNFLTTDNYISWAPGTSEPTPASNGSPVYITALDDNTTVFIDYGPNDGVFDATYVLNKLDVIQVRDPDNDNSGMHIISNKIVAVAWGESPNYAGTGLPYLDMGYTTLPLPSEWIDIVLEVEKTVTPAEVYIGGEVLFTVVISVPSTAGATVTNIDLVDNLPPGWEYVLGSGSPSDPTSITGSISSGYVLTWDLNWTINPGQSIVVTFRARATSSVNSTIPNRNVASATGEALGVTLTADDDAFVTIIIRPDLAVDKTHTGNFVVGSPGTYLITVTNVGTQSTTGPITVTDTLPAGLGFISGTGPGWSCSAVGQTVTCTNPGPLAPNTSSTITLTVSVGPEAVPSVTNVVTVHTPDDPNPNNNSDEDPTNVVAGDLSVEKTHTGDFIVGMTGVYTIRVTNLGPGSTIGTIAVTDTLPTGLTFVSGTGPGWTCSAVGQTVTCTNPGPLAPNSSSTITLTVSVGLEAVPSVINTVTVDTPGDDNPNNNSDDDPTNVLAPDLAVEKTHTGDFIVGTTGVYTITVTNVGTGPTTGTITVTDTLPTGLTFVSGTGPGWSCSAVGQTVTCTNPGPLAPNTSSTITLTVSVGPEAAPSVTNSVTVSTLGDSNPNNNSDDDPTNVLAPDLAVEKTHTGDFIVGTTGVYTITVTNVGTGPTTGTITVTDTLPTGLTFVSGTGPGWTCWAVGQTVTCTNPGPLAPNSSSTITLTVSVSLDAHPSVVNTVSVSTPGDTNLTNNSDDDPTNVLAPDLQITKSHVGNFVVGQNGIYTITVTNVGNAPTTGTITVTDTLPTGLTFVSGTGPGWTCWAVGQTVTCTNPGPLAPNTSSTITLTVSVGPEAVPSVTNSVTVTNHYDPDLSNNSDDDPTEVIPVADLRLTKTVNNPNPNMGDTIIFTVTVTNDGPNTATGVEVTDPVPSGLTFVSYTASQGSYNPVTGIWTVGTLNVGVSATLTLQAVVSTVEAITNTAEVTASDQLDPDSIPNNNNPYEDDQATVIVAGQIADLSLQKTVDNPTPGVGSTVTLTITVRNDGPNTATNVVVQDQMPSGLSFVSYTASQGSYNPGTGIWAIGNLPNGATATLTITATVTAAGSITNIAQVIGVDQPDPDSVPNNNDPTEDDQDDVTLEAQPADLSITKTHSGSFAVGYTGTYILTVTNVGAGRTTGAIIVTDTLPTGLTFVSGTGPGWTCSAALQLVTCTNPGPLGPGESTTITITVSVSGAAFPSVTNSASVSTPDDNNPDNNFDDDPTEVVAPDLQITKSHTGNFETGLPGIYTITVTNVGSGPTHGPIVVTDTLPTGLTFVSGTGPGWTCSAALQLVTCTNPGPLAPGASTTITLTVNVSRAALPGVINTVIVFTPDDTNPDNNSDDDPTDVEIGRGRICGFKWLDLDADGNRAENEPYLPGITITLVGVDLYGNPVSLSTVTDENGQYCFTNLLPGTYLICEAPPEHIPFFETFPVNGPVCPNGTIGWFIDLEDGQRVNRIKFGNVTDEPTLVSLSVTAIQALATPQGVYFRAVGQGIKEIAVELFDLSGRAIYRSGWQRNNLFWSAERVAPGVYLYFMTVKGYDGTIIKSELRKLVVSPKPSAVDQLLAKATPKIMVRAHREGIEFKLLGTRELRVQVFDLSGRPIYVSDWTSTSVFWSLQNEKGQRIAKGVYLYVVTVRGPDGKLLNTKLQKLIVK